MNLQGKIRVAALIAADLFCVYAVWFAVVLGFEAAGITQYRYGAEFYLRLWPVGVAFAILNMLFRLYHGNVFYPAAPLAPVEEMRRLAGSAFIAHMGALAVIVLALQTSKEYSRMVIIACGALTALLAQPCRDVVRALLGAAGLGQIPVVIMGAGAAAARATEALKHNRYAGLDPVGYFADAGEIKGLERLGGLRDAVEASRAAGVRILVACVDERVLRRLLPDLKEWFAYIEYLPSAAIFPVFGSRTVSFDGMGGVEMVNQGRMRFLRVEKWLLDKSLAVVAFVLLLPVFVAVALLVRLTSRGPVFYRQARLGQGGKPIKVWKFRSMYADADARLDAILKRDPAAAAEWNRSFKLKRDPRVTPFGRFLRRTSLDELPQLFNVFSGDMALVGPRPIVQAEVERYGASFAIMSSVRPGITGLWQASGRSETGYARRVALDVEYVLNWSPWMDLWILVRTVFAVLSLKGAC